MHLFATLSLAISLMTVMWLFSLWLKDVSIVDIVWAPMFAITGWVALFLEGGTGVTGWVALGLVTIWAIRLGAHLLLRRLQSDTEDRRYAAIRRKCGRYFSVKSLVIIFWFQAFLLWIISWPLQSALVADSHWTLLALIGSVTTSTGIIFEALSDFQLLRFLAKTHNVRRVLDKGLWRWSRHPNYFGDFLIWWGFFLIGISADSRWWTIISPVVMSALLIHFSGADLMEETIADRRPEYHEYIRRTSRFFPWPPARSRR